MISSYVAAQTAPQRPSGIEEKVRITFSNYKNALQALDGALAARYIDDETAALYEKIRLSALNAPRSELLKSTLFFQTAVLGVRNSFTKSDIQNIDGRALYGKIVSAGGASGAMGFESLSIVKVYPERDGLSAFADLGMEGRAEMFRIKFLNSRGQWRIYLRDLITIASDEYQALYGLRSTTPPEVVESVIVRYLFPAIAEQSRRPVSDEIWVPLTQRQ